MTEIKKEDIEEIAKVLSERLEENKVARCTFCVDQSHMEKHWESHEKLDQFLGFLDRCENLRWAILGKIMVTVSLGFVLLIGTLLWRHFKG